MGEIVRLGIQQIMELDRDEHIDVGSYERGEDRRSQRNGYKFRQLYTRVGTLILRVPQTRKIKMVTEQLMGREFSSRSISRFSATLDAELDSWREGPFKRNIDT